MTNPQNLAFAIKSIAKVRGITVKEMLTDCELSINTLSSMQSGGYFPRVEALIKIADYLGCSIDYLLGRTDSPTAINSHNTVNGSNNIIGNGSGNKTGNTLSEQESALVDIFNKLDVVSQAKLLVYATELEKEKE